VRITNSKTGVVTYARTSYWSSVSIAPGASFVDQVHRPENAACLPDQALSL